MPSDLCHAIFMYQVQMTPQRVTDEPTAHHGGGRGALVIDVTVPNDRIWKREELERMWEVKAKVVPVVVVGTG